MRFQISHDRRAVAAYVDVPRSLRARVAVDSLVVATR